MWCGASTGPGVRCLTFDRPRLCVVRCGAYVFPRQAPGSPQILRQAPPMSGDLPMCGDLPYFDRPRLCAVPGLTSYAWYPASLRHPRLCAVPGVLCFAYVRCSALLRQGPGCFDRPRLCLPSTAPAYVLCSAYLRHPPGVLCFACFACFALLALLTCFLHILRAVTLVVYMRKR